MAWRSQASNAGGGGQGEEQMARGTSLAYQPLMERQVAEFAAQYQPPPAATPIQNDNYPYRFFPVESLVGTEALSESAPRRRSRAQTTQVRFAPQRGHASSHSVPQPSQPEARYWTWTDTPPDYYPAQSSQSTHFTSPPTSPLSDLRPDDSGPSPHQRGMLGSRPPLLTSPHDRYYSSMGGQSMDEDDDMSGSSEAAKEQGRSNAAGLQSSESANQITHFQSQIRNQQAQIQEQTHVIIALRAENQLLRKLGATLISNMPPPQPSGGLRREEDAGEGGVARIRGGASSDSTNSSPRADPQGNLDRFLRKRRENKDRDEAAVPAGGALA